MKLLTTLAVTTALLLGSACAGLTARQEILIPSMEIAWVNVSRDCERGIQLALDTQDIDVVQAAGLRSEIIAMDSALQARDILKVADVNWHRLHQLALIAIEARDIGWNVKKILKLRLEKFHEAYVTLVKSL